MTAFSVYTNGMKVLSCKADRAAGTIPCVDGIRSMSILWIVLYQNFMVSLVFPMANAGDLRSVFMKYIRTRSPQLWFYLI